MPQGLTGKTVRNRCGTAAVTGDDPFFNHCVFFFAREGKGEDEPGARRPAGESVLDDLKPTTGLALCAMRFDWLTPLAVGAGPENYASG